MWLLVGGDSEIGRATHHALGLQGVPVAATTRRADRVAADRPFLDLAAPLDHWMPPAQTRAACIFAAIPRLNACAIDPAATAHINVTQTLALVERLTERDISVLFLSSNQVFDGSVPLVSAETPPCPVSEYGRQKARVEAALRRHMDAGARVGILRLAKVVWPEMPLIRGWIESLENGRSIGIFQDMTMAPTPTGIATAAIASLMQQQASGIFQLTGQRDATYFEIACYLADRVGAGRELVVPKMARDAGLPEGSTPRYTTLDSNLLRDHYGLAVPDVWAVMDGIMNERSGCLAR
jgi:dTDP-4-dehydrorhamnose reductase